MRLWLGLGTFFVGACLWMIARTRGGRPLLDRLGPGVSALGLATLASTQSGVWWSISAISFSIIAIVLLGLVLRESIRR